MKDEKKNNIQYKLVEYETSDFYFIAYLKAMGFEVKHVKKAGQHKRLIFILTGRIPLEAVSLSELYYANKSVINPLDFMHAIRDLKSYMYDGDGSKILKGECQNEK